jgi:hypothetical protein
VCWQVILTSGSTYHVVRNYGVALGAHLGEVPGRARARMEEREEEGSEGWSRDLAASGQGAPSSRRLPSEDIARLYRNDASDAANLTQLIQASPPPPTP